MRPGQDRGVVIDRKALLSKTKLFSGLSEPALELLSEGAAIHTYAKGDIVFHSGDSGDRLFVVASGLVKVFITSVDGEEIILEITGPPNTLGELALIHRGHRFASVRALEQTTLVSVGRNHFDMLLARQPEVTRSLLDALGELVQRTVTQVCDLVFLDLHGRVAKLLVQMADAQQGGSDPHDFVRLQINQADLARMVGGSRPAVNQVLKAFESGSYIERQSEKNTFRLDLPALKRRASL